MSNAPYRRKSLLGLTEGGSLIIRTGWPQTGRHGAGAVAPDELLGARSAEDKVSFQLH